MVLDNPDGGSGPLACPPETFANLLLLYSKYEYFDMAADLLAEHADLTYKHLSPVRNSRNLRNFQNLENKLGEKKIGFLEKLESFWDWRLKDEHIHERERKKAAEG